MISTPSDDGRDDVDFEPEDELGTVSALKAKLAKLRGELEASHAERQQYLDGWQRAKADLINERREHAQAARRAGDSAIARLVEELLPALDSFDMAMGAASWQSVEPAWRTGMESVVRQLETALASYDVVAFGAPGDAYDPLSHEIAAEVDAEGVPGTVARVLRRGWKLHERVIRPAHVMLVRTKS